MKGPDQIRETFKHKDLKKFVETLRTMEKLIDFKNKA